MRLVLTRKETGPQGTFGRLVLGADTLYTLELPWHDNQPNISCIPAATYDCAFVFSPRLGKWTYLIGDVPGRSGIRIHSANWAGDSSLGYRAQLNGCISLGERIGWLEGQKAVLVSRPAVSKLERILEREPFQLEIIG